MMTNKQFSGFVMLIGIVVQVVAATWLLGAVGLLLGGVAIFALGLAASFMPEERGK